MSSGRATRSGASSTPPLMPILLGIVIAVSLAGITAILLGLPNPLSRDKVASPEALAFYTEHVAALDVAAKDVMREAEFNFHHRDAEQCVARAGASERCGELEERFASYVTRMSDLVARARNLNPPDSDPTTQEWVDAFIRERTEDVDGLRAVAAAAAGGWNANAWIRGIGDFEDNASRGQSGEALADMLPNRLDFTPPEGQSSPSSAP